MTNLTPPNTSETPASTADTRTPRARPQALLLTQAAKARIATLMAQAPLGTLGVKLSTPKRGCSGLAYSLDYVSQPSPLDEAIALESGTLYVDSASVLYLIGSTMDWVEDDFTSGFQFQNPNAKGMCGCGESFMV
jgi:iron-sulfur cluster assembly protein